MIEYIRISNLRGIKTGEVDDLAPLSVVVGPNNSGKSTILEALFIGCSHGEARAAAYAARRRGWRGLSFVSKLAN